MEDCSDTALLLTPYLSTSNIFLHNNGAAEMSKNVAEGMIMCSFLKRKKLESEPLLWNNLVLGIIERLKEERFTIIAG